MSDPHEFGTGRIPERSTNHLGALPLRTGCADCGATPAEHSADLPYVTPRAEVDATALRHAVVLRIDVLGQRIQTDVNPADLDGEPPDGLARRLAREYLKDFTAVLVYGGWPVDEGRRS